MFFGIIGYSEIWFSSNGYIYTYDAKLISGEREPKDMKQMA
jgi:hypothetical protein